MRSGRLDAVGGIDQFGSAPVLGGQPFVGQVQVDPGGLDAQMPALACTASSIIPASRRRVRYVWRLMAGRVVQPGPAAGAAHDLIQSLRRQRQAASRLFSTNTRLVKAPRAVRRADNHRARRETFAAGTIQ